MINKNIFIVDCDVDRFEDYFSRKKCSYVINHHDIKKRLTNNDPNKTNPSTEVIQFNIQKKLNLFSRCKNSEFLYFLKEDVNEDFIQELKKLLKTSAYNTHFHLLIDDKNKKIDFEAEFNSIQLLEND